MILFSVAGFILNLIFLGLIVDTCRTLIEKWRLIHHRVIANDHTVVLGWTDKTLFLLGELAEEMIDSKEGRGTIVVLGELDPIEMQMEVKVAFPDWTAKWRKVRLRFKQGKPFEVDDLEKVSVHSAARIIVLGNSRKPRDADAQMLTTICALRCLEGTGSSISTSTKIIAEVARSQTRAPMSSRRVPSASTRLPSPPTPLPSPPRSSARRRAPSSST